MGGFLMKKTIIFKALITALLLAAIACILFGKNVLYGPGFTISNNYIDALIRKADTSFRMTTTVYVWILMICSIASIVLVWLKSCKMSMIAGIVCLIPSISNMVIDIANKYSPFSFDCPCDFFMFILPVAAAVLCFILFNISKKETA
jgi:hypothetical protein